MARWSAAAPSLALLLAALAPVTVEAFLLAPPRPSSPRRGCVWEGGRSAPPPHTMSAAVDELGSDGEGENEDLLGERLRMKIEAARRAARENDYEWYMQTVARFEPDAQDPEAAGDDRDDPDGDDGFGGKFDTFEEVDEGGSSEEGAVAPPMESTGFGAYRVDEVRAARSGDGDSSGDASLRDESATAATTSASAFAGPEEAAESGQGEESEGEQSEGEESDAESDNSIAASEAIRQEANKDDDDDDDDDDDGGDGDGDLDATRDETPPSASASSSSEEPDKEGQEASGMGVTPEGRAVLSALVDLGFSEAEAQSLSPDAAVMVIELGFRRPASAAIPAEWLSNSQQDKQQDKQQQQQQQGEGREVSSSSRLRGGFDGDGGREASAAAATAPRRRRQQRSQQGGRGAELGSDLEDGRAGAVAAGGGGGRPKGFLRNEWGGRAPAEAAEESPLGERTPGPTTRSRRSRRGRYYDEEEEGRDEEEEDVGSVWEGGGVGSEFDSFDIMGGLGGDMQRRRRRRRNVPVARNGNGGAEQVEQGRGGRRPSGEAEWERQWEVEASRTVRGQPTRPRQRRWADDESWQQQQLRMREQSLGPGAGSGGMEMGEQLQWPDLGSFKDMLRDESLMRIGVMGPWIVPGVRAENQLRIYLYKWWLRAVDEGIGDPAILEPLPPKPTAPTMNKNNNNRRPPQQQQQRLRSSRRGSSSRNSRSSRGYGSFDDGFDFFDAEEGERGAPFDARGDRFERF